MKVSANEILDEAILLKDGGVIAISCRSYREMEALRTKLYRVKRQLEGKYSSMAKAIDITRKIERDKNKWTLLVSKDLTVSEVVIIEDGIVRPFERTETIVDNSSEEERIKRLMSEDLLASQLAESEAQK